VSLRPDVLIALGLGTVLEVRLVLKCGLPAAAERSSCELDFRLALIRPWLAHSLFPLPRIPTLASRCSEIGESAELFRSLVELCVYEVCQAGSSRRAS
jgi:hypothetical protein